MDRQFISRVTSNKILNFDATDFTKLQYKDEIQSLFKSHYFPNLDLKILPRSITNKQSLNTVISLLRNMNKEGFNAIFKYPIRGGGFGPGEILLYFIIYNAKLGGRSSRGVDLEDAGKKYEIKAAKTMTIGSYRAAYDFNIPVSTVEDVILPIKRIAAKLGFTASERSIERSTINKIKNKSKIQLEKFNEIEQIYAELALPYFKNHKIIFLENETTSNLGDILSIQTVKKEDIKIERISEGKVRPYITIRNT